LLALAGTAGSALAQTTYIWTGAGGDGKWSTAANWGGTAPGSSLTNTRVVLTTSTNPATTIDAAYGNTLQLLGLRFGSAAGAFTVGSSGPVLELGAEGLRNDSGQNQRVTAPIRLGADQYWTNNSNLRVGVSGPVDLNGRTLTVGTPVVGNATGFMDLSGPISGTGVLAFAAGRAVLTGGNAHTGGTRIDRQSWVMIDSADNLGAGPVEFAGNSTLDIRSATDSTLAGPLTVTDATGVQFPINYLQFTAPAAVTLLLQPGGLRGAGRLGVAGNGSLLLTGANPYSGEFSIGGAGARVELIDTGGGASLAARGYSVYNATFRVGPGATLVQAAGAASRPYVGVDGTGRAVFEQSQTLSGVTVGNAGDPNTENPTLTAAPGVTLTLDFGATGYFGTINAVLAGSPPSGGTFFVKGAYTVPGKPGTLTVTGLNTFTGPVRVDAGVLSVDTLKPTGQPSALGVGGAGAAGEIRLWRTQFGPATLRYTGPTTATDRTLQVLGSDALNQPSIVEVTDPAATLTWSGPVRIDYNNVVSKLQKSGAGALVIASAGNSLNLAGTGGGLGSVRVAAGTLGVTGSMQALVTVESGATATGKLLGGNTSNYRVRDGNAATAMTVKAGGTVRAGMGSSTDVLGIDGVQFDAGSKFVVTVDGGAAPTASKIQRNSNGGAINFSPQTTDAGRITLLLEKGTGAEFIPHQPVTVEIARGGVTRWNSSFAYNANEWTPITSGFDIVPGSFSLFTTESGWVLNARFTPVPEPTTALAVGAAALAGLAARRRRR
jgi:fibronectin-binding autotransporter adhesin